MLTIRPNAALLAGLVPVLAFAPQTAQAGRTPAITSASAAFQLRIREHYGPAGNASDYSVIVAAGQRAAWIFGGTNPGGASTPLPTAGTAGA